VIDFIFDLLHARNQSDPEKDLAILLLCQPLRIVERKQKLHPT
jgi:hypothetical protein